jgi:hypothetical protein
MIIQLILQGTPLAELKAENCNPTMEANTIWPHAIRTAKCKCFTSPIQSKLYLYLTRLSI